MARGHIIFAKKMTRKQRWGLRKIKKERHIEIMGRKRDRERQGLSAEKGIIHTTNDRS